MTPVVDGFRSMRRRRAGGIAAAIFAIRVIAIANDAPDEPISRPSPGSPSTITVLAKQPAVDADDVDERIVGNIHPPSETFLVRIGNMGERADRAAPAWDIGGFTGFRPAPDPADCARYQRGPSAARPATAVQLRGREIGIWIDSDHPRPDVGDLLPVTPGYWWWAIDRAPRPFATPGNVLSFAFDLKIPTAERHDGAEVYLCAYFSFRDARTGKSTWYGASVFDLRGPKGDLVLFDGWEGGTNAPILLAHLTGQSEWLHPGPGSASFRTAPFDEYARFEFRITADEMKRALGALKKRFPETAGMSGDPADYQLTHFNVNPEVYAPVGAHGRLGISLRGIRVAVVTASP